MRQFHDEVVGIGFLDSSFNVLHGDILTAVADVFCYGGGKQHRLLTHHASDFPQVSDVHGSDVLSIDADLK